MKNLVKWMVFLLVSAAIAGCGEDIKKQPLPPGFNSTVDTNASTGSNATTNNSSSPLCLDGVQNLDESDVDCGGNTCAACDIGNTCTRNEDCLSRSCEAGICADQPLPTGSPCTDSAECASGQCASFGAQVICTEPCQTTCPGENLACFGGECVPDTFCDDPEGDGFGFGPGCSGQPCDRCATTATCAEQGDGSFTCICNGGFDGDGFSCVDIDECAANPCDPNADCANLAGSFTCSCPAGFSGDGTQCSDIDECATGANNCSLDATCSNLAGTFSCACEPGFTGDGVTCSDIDECATGADNCSTNATCTNESGGFSCACNTGYTGDGVSCVLGKRPPSQGEVVISEIMQNPNAQLDSDGEWFELYNASSATLNLDGCRVISSSSSGSDEFTIISIRDMAPGEYFVFSRSASFGGFYDYTYNGMINLNNTSDDLEIRCVTQSGFERIIDSVAWDDGATFPDPDGASMNLSSSVLNATSNDLGANWCEGTAAYYLTDLGTPGAANRACP